MGRKDFSLSAFLDVRKANLHKLEDWLSFAQSKSEPDRLKPVLLALTGAL
jgi:hypothetical protein